MDPINISGKTFYTYDFVEVRLQEMSTRFQFFFIFLSVARLGDMAFATSLKDCVTLDKKPGQKLDLSIEKSN